MGGIGRPSASGDPISGLILGVDSGLMAGDLAKFDPVVVGSVTLYVTRLTAYVQLALLGISRTEATEEALTATQVAANFVDYHVSEFFRLSPNGTLYLAVKLTGDVLGGEMAALQDYAGGAIRQIGVGAAGTTTPAASVFGDYQTTATAMESGHKPASILVGLRKGAMAGASGFADLSAPGRCNVSVFAGKDLDPAVDARLIVAGKKYEQVAGIGALIGAVSRSAVHESIAWVQKFPLGFTLPGLVTGESIKELPASTLSELDEKRVIFPVIHVGTVGCYLNDSHTLDVATSDYAYIENVRTIDKAVRGIRSNLLPQLNAPLYVDPETGTLDRGTVAFLETLAGRALEDMEKAGELSGYRAEIDPEQNVLATSEVEVVIRNVPVGVMRKVKVKIGFATKLN
jgi:hypothetical protein